MENYEEQLEVRSNCGVASNDNNSNLNNSKSPRVHILHSAQNTGQYSYSADYKEENWTSHRYMWICGMPNKTKKLNCE